ncbi:MAG: Flp pilus assembly protein CpaB [Bdellovibrionales bacterium]
MNKNIVIVFAGAILVAVLAVVLMQFMMKDSKKPKVVQEAKVEILMAAKDLSLGHELKSGDLAWQSWPKAGLFAGAIKRKDDQAPEKAIEGRLARNVAKGEPMMASALLGGAKGNFVAASLEPGMRAMAIDVKASSMVAGFIEPGDYVDVVLTYKETIKPDSDDPRVKALVDMNIDKLATETILQHVKVLAVDQRAKRPDDDKVKVGKTVTLALSVQDAERLALAASLGSLDLVLRGVGDDAVVEKDWPTVSDARLTSMDDEIMLEYEKLKKDTSISGDSMRIYNGAQVQRVPVQ